MVARRRLAELGHLAEDRHPAPVAGARDEIEQRRAHRGRVRVVGVVDDEASSRQRQLLATPAGERDRVGARLGAIERQPERLVGDERGERVLGHVAGGERQRQA